MRILAVRAKGSMEACLQPADLEGFSALSCRNRWLALHRLRLEAKLDGLLLVLGPDGQLCRGAEVAWNWLLQGLSGREVLMAPLDTKFEECVICLRGDRTIIFCSSAVRAELGEKTALWEAIEIVAPTKEEEADQDRFDELKIGTFFKMVDPCGTLGVAMRKEEVGSRGLEMEIERWPVVQAHAYDEFGRGFMTLSKKIANIETDLQRVIYPSWDSHSVLWARGLAARLRTAWDEAIGAQDKKMGEEGLEQFKGLNRPALKSQDASSEANIAEPFVDMYDYGRISLEDAELLELRDMGSAKPSMGSLKNLKPRVLLGPQRTPLILTEERSSGATWKSEEAYLKKPVLHAIWEAVDPVVSLAVTRTYAIAGGLGGDDASIASLLSAYSAIRCCVQELLRDGGAAQQAAFEPDCADKLKKAADQFLKKKYPQVIGTATALDVVAAALDATGLPVDASQAGVVLLVLRLSLGLKDQGVVSYGDSVFSARCSSLPGAPGAIGSVFPAPPMGYVCWMARDAEKDRSSAAQIGLKSALGLDRDVQYVRLGHRRDMQIPVGHATGEDVAWNDPLALGQPVTEPHSSILAVCLDPDSTASTVVWEGVLHTFESGRAVFISPKLGHLVFHPKAWLGAKVTERAEGLTWLCAPLALQPEGVPLASVSLAGNVALAIHPDCLEPYYGEDVSKMWLEPGTSEAHWLSSVVPEGRLPGASSGFGVEVLSVSSLAVAHGANMSSAKCSAIATPQQSSGRARVVWVCGLPGCGALDLASSLAHALQAKLVQLRSTAIFNKVLLKEADLVGTVAAQIQSEASGAPCIVVCDELCAPSELFPLLEANAGFSSSFYVVNAVAIVEPSIFYTKRGSRHPMVLSRTLRGWVSNVVAPAYEHGAANKSDWERHLLTETMNKEIRAARGEPVIRHLSPAQLLAEEMGSRDSTSAAVREMVVPEGTEPCKPQYCLFATFTPVANALDVEALACTITAAFDAANEAEHPPPGKKQEQKSPWWGLFCVEVHAKVSSSRAINAMEPKELLDSLQGENGLAVHKTMYTCQGELKRELKSPGHWSPPLSQQEGIVCWWSLPKQGSVDCAALQAAVGVLIETCRLSPPSMRPLWTIADIPEEQKKMLEAEALRAGLPDGYFFDGGGYVDVNGHKQQQHPQINEFFSKSVETHNAQVRDANEVLVKVAALPMFNNALNGAKPPVPVMPAGRGSGRPTGGYGGRR